MKLVEKSGFPLANMFKSKFPLEAEYSLGSKCTVFDNDSIKCAPKGVVYVGECLYCTNLEEDILKDADNEDVKTNFPSSKYVGESSRQFRMRVKEHLDNARALKFDSFIISHWMESHGIDMFIV